MSKKELLGKLGSFGSLGSLANIGMNTYFGVSDYMDARDRGQGVLSSIAEGAMGFVLPEVMGMPLYLGYELLSNAGSIGMSMYEQANTQFRQLDRQSRNQMPFRNYTFVDGPQIATMRQAGLALARRSKYELQQTMMGNEARYLHR